MGVAALGAVTAMSTVAIGLGHGWQVIPCAMMWCCAHFAAALADGTIYGTGGKTMPLLALAMTLVTYGLAILTAIITARVLER